MTTGRRPSSGSSSGRPSYGGGRPSYGGGGGRSDKDGKSSMGKGGRFFARRRVCHFCVDKAVDIDYKDVPKLSRYVSDRGRIQPRRRSGVCARHQRMLSSAIKRARQLALLPFTLEHIKESGMSFGPPSTPRERRPYGQPYGQQSAPQAAAPQAAPVELTEAKATT